MRLLSTLILVYSIAVLYAYPDGTPIQLYTCNGSDRQSWDYNSADQIFTLRADGKCIDIADYSTDNGALVWLYDCHTSDKDPSHQNQEWQMQSNQEFVNPMSKKCLDANAYGTTPGTAVQLWDCTGADNQKWVYNPTDGTIKGVQSNLCVDAGSPLPRPCDIPENKKYPFCDTTKSFDVRVADLVGRIPQAEKYGLLVNGASGIPSLNISSYQWWSEGLHGVAYSPGVHFAGNTPVATSFPQIIGMGASFDMPLVNQMATTISTEGRGMNYEKNAGLTYWAPNVNIVRDPRWGRGQETPGEDPYLTSQYAINFVTGMQGGLNGHYLKVSSCCKHYTAYDLENWDGVDRHHFNAIVTQQDLMDTFMPPFKSCVEGGQASSIMCSYNEVNGIPSCANHLYNTEYARNEWGFQGYITGDCGAVDDVQNTHHYTNNPDQTCLLTISSGLDSDCGGFLSSNLQKAYTDGVVNNTVINAALTHLFLVQMRLGMFDPDNIQPYRSITAKDINTAEAQALALTASRESMVLLKNDGKLPFSKDTIKSLAVIGPNAQASTVLQGNYYGAAPYLVTPQQGLAKYATVTYARGCNINDNDKSGFSAACSAASSADATIIVVGLDQSQESEGRDRTSIALPGVQNDLITQITTCSKGPIVVVVITGGSVDLTVPKNSNKVNGILWAGYPGQSGGDAIAQTIFGDNNPAGRLPYTIYPSSFVNQVSMFDMGMRPNASSKNPGRTYRFYTGTPVYGFGDGLFYTTFNVVVNSAPVKISYDLITDTLKRDEGITASWKAPMFADISMTITNTGNRASDYTALGFVIPPNAGKDGNPIRYLIGFTRIHNLGPGQKTTVNFPVTSHDLSLINEQGERYTKTGIWTFQIEDQLHPIYVV
jgi:beta-glucosidase-like glycosyl hydrolase